MNKILESVMQNAIRSNPQAMQILNEANQSGLSPKEFFFKKSKEMGIDPTDILNELHLD